MLTKHNLHIAKIADGGTHSTRYALDCVHITPAETVVTDGCALIRVSAVNHDGMAEEFEPFTIPAEHALEIAAAMQAAEGRNEWNEPKMPFPATVAEGEDGVVKISFSDAKQHERTFEVPKVSRPFPNWPVVVPGEGDAVVSADVNLDLLISVLKQVRKFSRSVNGWSKATIRLYASDKQIRIDAKSDYEQTMTAVVMPMMPDGRDVAKKEVVSGE